MSLSFYLILLLTLFVAVVTSFAPLNGVVVNSVSSGDAIDLGRYLSTPGYTGGGGAKTLLILGTYAADFNAIEYAQRLRYYLPKLQECGVSKFGMVLSCQPSAARALAELVDLPVTADSPPVRRVDLLVDNTGRAGRAFGVERGWLPDNENVSPFIKLFGMLWGLGAWATLPAVIGGYLGNPFTPQPWIEDALAVGQRKGRWPDNALEIDSDNGTIIANKFAELPLVGQWKRRPLELATLRLQSMIGISLAKWSDLAPDEEALKAGVLTQLGGCVIVDSSTDQVLFEWRDQGICHVANFEDILAKLKQNNASVTRDKL